MDLIRTLARVDQRVLPRLARGSGRIKRLLGGRRPRLLSVVAAVLVAAVIVTLVLRLGEPPGGTGVGPSIRVGVSQGDSVPQYIAGSRVELDRLRNTDPHTVIYALVSLKAYVTAQRVTELISAAGPGVISVAAYARVPLPRRQTELIRLGAQQLPDDLVRAMATAAQRKDHDAAQYLSLAQQERDADLRRIYSSNAEVATQEAAALRQPDCSCIFAMVVRADPVTLLTLANEVPIRVVDPAPEVARLDATVFAAPLPEQLDVVGPPPDDALDPTSTPSPK